MLLPTTFGQKPKRNRADLITRILTETLNSPRTESTWNSAVKHARSSLTDTATKLCEPLSKILTLAENITKLLAIHRPGYEESLDDAKQHLDQLLHPGWLLHTNFSTHLINLRGLEMRLTRMFGSPPAKDLAKLTRYQTSAAEIWAEEATCDCGECTFPPAFQAQQKADAKLRLHEFAQELRR